MTEWRSTGFVRDSDEEDEPGSFVTESPPIATAEASTCFQNTVRRELTADQNSESEARQSIVIAGKDAVHQPAQVAKENDGEERGQDVTMQDHANVVEPIQKPREASKLSTDHGDTAEALIRDGPRMQIHEREPKDVAMEDVAAEESLKKPNQLDSSDDDADMDELALDVPLRVSTGVTHNVPRKFGPSRRTKTYGRPGPKQKSAKASHSYIRKETEELRVPQDDTFELPRPGCNIVEVVVQRVHHDVSMDQVDEPSLSIRHEGPTQVAPMAYFGDLEDLANETTVNLSRTDSFEIPSSPLSTPPMSPVINAPQQPRPFHGTPGELPNSAPPQSDTQEVIAQRSISNRGPSATGQAAFVDGLASRTLRTREAIQLHPYLIEGEQYRKTLRSRGLRPIQVAVGPRRTNGVEATETQKQSFDVDDDSQNAGMLESSPLALSSSQNTFSHSSSPPVVPAAPPLQLPAEDDDEFPDLDVVLNRTVVGGVQQGYKRRRTTHAHAAHDTHSRSADESARQRSAGPQPASGVAAPDIFDVPPSPPPTSSTSGPLAVHGIEDTAFKVPRGFSPPHMPTPLPSSETRPFGRVFTDELSETDSLLVSSVRPRSRKQPRRALTMESSSEESLVESEHDDSQLRRARKRIKGVLPASWLKLDRQAQIKTTNVEKTRVESIASPLRLMPQKGVAQKICAAGRRSRSHSLNTGNIADVVAILDGSDSSESLAAAREPAIPRQARLSISGSYVDSVDDRAGPADAMEDNWIDPMLPPASRYKSGKANLRKEQSQLHREFAYASNGVPNATRPVSAHTVATRQGHPGAQLGGLTKARARKLTVPRLSILDAPKSPSQSSHPTPLFLRIATRQARRQSDQGRHSPTGKYMRLQTRQDTEDANSTLRAWREGTIVASRTCSKTRDDVATHSADPPLVLDADHSASTVGHRLPLQKLKYNQQQRRLPSPTKQHSVALGDQRTSHGNQAQARVGSAHRANPVLRQRRLEPMVVKTSGLMNPVSVPSSRQPFQPASRPSHQRPRPRQAVYRDAQLETSEAEFADKHRRAAFHTNLHRVNRAFQHRFDLPTQSNFQLARFLHDEDAVGSLRQTESANPDFTPAADVQGGTGLEVSIVRRPRKRATHRIDADAIEYRQPSEPMPVDDGTVSVVSEPPSSRTQPALRGLGAFGTRYPVDFDVHPLELGTYFHQSTLIGSGDFDDSLSLRGRDLDVPAGHISIQCNNKNMQWSCWTDEVASDLSTVFTFISDQIQACTRSQQSHELDNRATSAAPRITYLLRSVVRYLSGRLSFLDPVDRRSCVVRVFHILGDLLHGTLTSTGNAPAAQQVSTLTGQLVTRTMLFILVLARQVLQVANHPSVKASVKSDTEGLILSIARQLIGTIMRPSTSQIRDFFEKNRRHLFREAGIGDEDLSVEVVVITAHTLSKASIAGHGIWTMINEVLTKSVEKVHHVQVLDRIWQDSFSILPLLEIDASGLLRVGRRFEYSIEDWTLIKTLLSRLFVAYSETSRAQSSTINTYVRAVLNRCHCLVQNWGWRRCETMLSTVFDFFARNGLAQLHLEGSRGSPRFLEHLDQDLRLTVDPEDRAFHIFLKILATGLRGMQGIYTDQKIRGIAWRFIPNHGRTYRKDEAVRQEDLDALRNHHDLLCTLYWSSPVGFQPRIDLLRNLVDHSTSHREACRLNIRSWANLVKYQLSTDEAVSTLDPFALWHREIVDVTIAQYKLARTEAESQFEAARTRGTLNISNELLQSTISTNQRQVLATLSDAISAMREAIKAAKSEAASSALLLSSSVMEVFSLFDAKNVSVNAAIVEALSIVPAYLNHVGKLQGQAESQQHSEESQDYGDWSGFEEVAADPGYGHTTDGFFDFIHEPLSQLLSNCFGSEVTPEDALLTKVVDSWTLPQLVAPAA
ncbi:hypothetical protein B0A49_10356 [Cryomyces minteri]|uniref:Uncharacterized protein n=1 Tax=Cryomyces minteri TaxID=331657 RepID=A0A4U0WNX5_9PEZI|nr:hypothetical protein B0A49_10356 [Cryomyces minteri]